MYPVSPQFIQALRDGAQVVTRADVFKRGQKILELPVVEGSVSDDSSAAVRRRCSLDISLGDQPELYVPSRLSEDGVGLWPNGMEIKLYQGVRHKAGGDEMVPLGVYRISRPAITDSGDDLKMSVEGFDRSRAVSRARFQDAYQLKHTDLSTAIKAVLLNQCAWLDSSVFEDEERWMRTDGFYGSTGYFVPRATFDRTDDPWQACVDMAKAAGAEVFFDLNGLPTLRPQPDPETELAVFAYDEGEDNLALELDRDLDDEDAYNGVICTGENTANNQRIVSAQVWDTDPTSATYYDPKYPFDTDYGPVPCFMTSQYVETDAQALAAAQGEFNRQIGIIENISMTTIANFAHQSSDIIHIKRDRIQVNGNYVLESFTCKLGPEGTLDGTTRRRGTR